MQVAEQVSIVDQLSEGRFIYGAGGRTRGNDARREHFFEFLEVLKQLWTEDHFSGFEGKYYTVSRVLRVVSEHPQARPEALSAHAAARG